MSADLSGFGGLDDDYTGIMGQWLTEIRQEFATILIWWQELQQRLDHDGRPTSRLHWPAGPASHPRVIAIYRKYYFLLNDLNVRRALALDAEDMGPAEEEDWGNDEVEGPDDVSGPLAPNLMLLEMMESYAPDLWEHFRLFVYTPVGEDMDSELC